MYIQSYDDFFEEYLLLELSENSTLYHRSSIKHKVGDIIRPNLKKDGTHWLSHNTMEMALEYFRQENFPDRPSRFDCVYATPYPRSRFVDKGTLYVIKPIGKVFMTDSMLIDKLNMEFDRSTYDMDYDKVAKLKKDAAKGDKDAIQEMIWMLPSEAHEYWRGEKFFGKDFRNDIEILCESAVVTEVINDDRLKAGQTVIIDSPGLNANINILFNSSSEKTSFTREDAENFIRDVSNELFDDPVIKENSLSQRRYKGPPGFEEMNFRITGTLKVGAKLKIALVTSSLYNKTANSYTDNPVKYLSITTDFYLGRKLYKRVNEEPYFRMEITHYLNPGVYDLSSYFKK